MSIGSSDASTAALKQHVFAQYKKSTKTKGLPKSTTLASYVGVFLLVITLVAIGYQPPQKTDTAQANAAQIGSPDTDATSSQPSVDQVIATTVAGDIAERANLPIAPNVAELSVSLSVKSELAQTDDSIISKPQIVQPTAGSRDTKTYTTKAGDTVASVAAQYGISAQTIRWSNNLVSDALEAGKQLTIPPVDGIVYTVKNGDTVASLAGKYGADANRIVTFNDLEISGLANGASIIIPGGILPEAERPGYVAPRTSYSGSGVSASQALASAGNKYAPGYCTWYVYERRLSAGQPIGSYWGNASAWAASARAAGLRVDHSPEAGAIMQNGGGAGHVAYVERVAADGTITYSDMNGIAGFGRVGTRTMTAGQAVLYNYIH